MAELLPSDEYYTLIQRGQILNQLYQIGQLFWAPSLFLFGESQQYFLRSEYVQSRNDYEYQVAPLLQGEFDNLGSPDQTLGLGSDERAMIIRAKRRPVILISRAGTEQADSTRRLGDCFLVAPVYSFGGDEVRAGYPQDFIERVKAYVYWNLFYLPAYTHARIRESFVRLDRIQAIHKNLLEHMPVTLSDDAQYLFQSWIRVYHGEELDTVNGMLFDYREHAIAQLA